MAEADDSPSPGPATEPAAAEEGARPATRPEVVAKLKDVPVFSVIDLSIRSMCATMIKVNNKPVAVGTYFCDERDAKEHMGMIMEHNPGLSLAVDGSQNLGNAFALSERWAKNGPNVPLRIQASKATLQAVSGFPQLPEELRNAFNPLSSRFPLWLSSQMHATGDMAFFLHLDDLVQAWCDVKSCTKEEAHAALKDKLEAVDLRVLCAPSPSRKQEPAPRARGHGPSSPSPANPSVGPRQKSVRRACGGPASRATPRPAIPKPCATPPSLGSLSTRRLAAFLGRVPRVILPGGEGG